MNGRIFSSSEPAPFRKTSETGQLSQCTPDNPFGVQRRPPPQLRSMEGVHYTSDPIAERIKTLRAIQNLHIAAIGAAVAIDIAATIEAIKSLGAVSWASNIIKAVLDITDDLLDDAPDKKDVMPYEKVPEPGPLSNFNSDTTERIDRYIDRMEEKVSATETIDTDMAEGDG